MKKIFLILIIFIFSLFFFYLLGSFIELSFNISDWRRGIRIAVGAFGMFVVLGGAQKMMI